MMIINAVFHIYEYKQLNGCEFLDGRLLHDIILSDDNRNCDKDGMLIVSDDIPYEVVRINKIFSYGENWEGLPAGMSARLECRCSIKNLKDLLLCKIEEIL